MLGCHYLTKSRGEELNPRAAEAGLAPGDPRRLRMFNSPGEVRAAQDNGEVPLHGLVALRASSLKLAKPVEGAYVITTPGACCSTTSCRPSSASSTRRWTRSASRTWSATATAAWAPR